MFFPFCINKIAFNIWLRIRRYRHDKYYFLFLQKIINIILNTRLILNLILPTHFHDGFYVNSARELIDGTSLGHEISVLLQCHQIPGK